MKNEGLQAVTELNNSEYDRLVQAIYQGPLEDKPWNGLLRLVSEQIPGAIASIVFRVPSQGDQGFIRHIDDGHEWARIYDTHFSAKDPFTCLPENQVLSIWDCVGEKALLASEYYEGFMQPLSVADVIGFDIDGNANFDDGLDICFRLCLISEDKTGRFSESIKTVLSLIAKHLLLAARLHLQILKGRSMLVFMTQHLESLDVAAFAIEDNGNLLIANEAAAPFIKEADCFVADDQTLKLISATEQKKFMQAIDDCIDSYRLTGRCETWGLLVSSKKLGPITIIIKPVPETLSYSYTRPVVFLMIYNHQRELVINHKLLNSIYGLTSAECNLIDLLIQGEDIKDAAALLNITVNTARSHTKSIYSKTGINRQIDLINLIWRTVI